MDTNLRNIRKKLAGGEKLTASDLRSLQALHDAIYDEEGRVVGNTAGKENEMNDDPLTGEFRLDYVDRSFLEGKNHQGDASEKNLPRLVRYVGKPSTEGKSCAHFRLKSWLVNADIFSSDRSLCCFLLASLLQSILIFKQAWFKINSIQNITKPTTAGDGRSTLGTTRTALPTTPLRVIHPKKAKRTADFIIWVATIRTAWRSGSLWWWSRFPLLRTGSFAASRREAATTTKVVKMRVHPNRRSSHRCLPQRENENEALTMFMLTKTKP